LNDLEEARKRENPELPAAAQAAWKSGTVIRITIAGAKNRMTGS
jgi:hypothetical protein